MLRTVVALSAGLWVGVPSTALAQAVQQEIPFEACQQSLQPNGPYVFKTLQDTPDVKQVEVSGPNGTVTATCTRADSKLTLTPQ